MKKTKTASAATFLLLLVVLACYLSPLLIMVFGSFKSYSEIMSQVLDVPQRFSLDNFRNVFTSMNYPKSLWNTLLVTTIGVAGIVVISSLAGYKLSRVKTRYSYILFLFCIMPMMIPFQSFMITLVKLAKQLGLLGNLYGLGVIYWGLGAPLSIFLYHGFVKGIPHELEECAMLDGCSSLRMFISVIFPMLRPVTASVVVVNAMWIWNDFLLPLLTISNNDSIKTLQLAAYGFMGQYKMEWQNIMAGAIMIIIPALIVYLIFQKNIVKGMVAGAVKG
ncbi:L-arabinose transport system permease protein AraQ [Caprobacter fermentans]|uniref:Carbohydrate ABC transporter permease n=1 Tax=Caproicibacter fermentans TaxID=2576756 RepID=A0A6N8I2J2_9FIRM|nr:carbohydrate ABC transporter permease [Caproicibacter fermentans]MVB12294.1 L-arabinose transport system permease protein AraQ [Caproicibacter fermentans]QNK39778.1 carbohydrate ABC transporter permease [Caproicibacter fermentans]